MLPVSIRGFSRKLLGCFQLFQKDHSYVSQFKSPRAEGAAAIAQFNGKEINGRRLIVNEEDPPMTRAAGACFGPMGVEKRAANAASSARE
jgi:hypothetical protein